MIVQACKRKLPRLDEEVGTKANRRPGEVDLKGGRSPISKRPVDDSGVPASWAADRRGHEPLDESCVGARFDDDHATDVIAVREAAKGFDESPRRRPHKRWRAD